MIRHTLALLSLCATLSACMASAPEVSPAQNPAQTPPVIGMGNPASIACVRSGGRLDILDGPGGQTGVCIFPDGRRCEEWALFRDGRCHDPAKSSVPPQPAPPRPQGGSRP